MLETAKKGFKVSLLLILDKKQKIRFVLSNFCNILLKMTKAWLVYA